MQTEDAIAQLDGKIVDIHGVRIHNVTRAETLSLLESMTSDHGKHLVVPVNPEMIMAARKRDDFRDVLNEATLRLPDGIGVILASRVIGNTIKERITGVDTVTSFARIAAQRGLRFFLLGAAPGIAERAGRILQQQNPGFQIAGTYSGSPSPEEEESICGRINSANADVLLVAYGAPKQELWLHRNIGRLNVTVGMCVGGSFDFIAGVALRAPRWMQAAGLEWLYRLIREPRRWRRMLALPRFALAVVKDRLTSIFRRRNVNFSIEQTKRPNNS